MSRQILLTQGKFALVDDTDYDWLNQWKWCAERNNGTWYAKRNSTGTKAKRTKIYMHREILQPPPEFEGDHINRNGLDNRRCNLRNVTHWQNGMNRGHAVGVHYDKCNHRWIARMQCCGKQHTLGRSRIREVAENIYARAASKRLNGQCPISDSNRLCRKAGTDLSIHS